MARKKRFHGMNRFGLYATRKHLVGAFLTILLPFLALLFFARLTHLALPIFAWNIVLSSWRLLIAYLLAATLSWVFAVFFFRGPGSSVALPLFDVLQSFPTFAALPLAASLFGATDATVIFFLVITVIWPIFFSITSSLKLIRRDWEDAVKIAGLKGWNFFRYFLLPATLPGLITGSIIGLGEGWEALVATEMLVGVKSGLGPFFNTFSHNAPITLLGIFGLLFVIFAINKILWLPLLDWSHEVTEE